MRKTKLSRQQKAILFKSIERISPFVLMAAPDNSLNMSTFNATLNNYFQDFDQDIRSEMNIAFLEPGALHNLLDRWNVVDMIEDELILPNVIITDYLHNKRVASSDTTFNPTVDAIQPDARILKVRKYEGDLQFIDDELETTFMMYKTEMKRLARANAEDKVIGYVQYLFINAILAKGHETLHKATYQSVFADTTPYSWTKICNGVEKLITDEIAAGSITAIAMTSPTVTNIESLVESVYYDLGEAEREAPDVVIELSPAMHKLWITRNSSALGRQSNFDSAKQNTIYGKPNAAVVLAPYLTANKVFCTRKANKYIGVRDEAIKPWEAQRFDRLTKLMFNGKIGVQLARVNPIEDNQNVSYGA